VRVGVPNVLAVGLWTAHLSLKSEALAGTLDKDCSHVVRAELTAGHNFSVVSVFDVHASSIANGVVHRVATARSKLVTWLSCPHLAIQDLALPRAQPAHTS